MFFKLNTALLFVAFLLSCRNDIEHSIQSDLYSDTEEVMPILAKKWLLMPFVPVKGIVGEGIDYGKFIKKIRQSRPGQKIQLFGENFDKMENNQTNAYKAYIAYVREHNSIPDSGIFKLVADSEAEVLATPYVHSLQLLQIKEGVYLRRVVIILKLWHVKTQKTLLKLRCTSTHSSIQKDKLLPADMIFKAGLEAISKKLILHPLSGFTPSSNPDY